MTEMLHRRHRLQLDLEADDLPEIVHQLERIALDIEIEASKGREQREVTSGGYSSGHHLTLVTDEEMTGDRYRAWLDKEFTRRRRQRATQDEQELREAVEAQPGSDRWSTEDLVQAIQSED